MHRSWRRLIVPSYMCPQVVESVAEEIAVEAYPCRPSIGPRSSPIALDAGRGDVVLDINIFGLRERSSLDLAEGVDVIEDHSHDPWSCWAKASRAAFAFASLRKVLPLPSGGVVWSPIGLPVPQQFAPTAVREAASAERLKAMILKKLYLAGHDVDKASFRALAQSGESKSALGPISGMPAADLALLGACPIEMWRTTRLANYQYLTDRLSGASGITVLEADGIESVPFSVVVVFLSERIRDLVRERLISRRIYPAILWDLDRTATPWATQTDVDLSKRMLSIHVDWRYGPSDLDAAAEILSTAVDEATAVASAD